MSDKKGGPYTKSQQQKRRAQVYEMHFTKGYHTFQIAQELDVNKNTITEDIRYWYDVLYVELQQTAKDWALKQYSRLEEQRTRLADLLSKQEDIGIILKIEKMIMDLDRAICKFLAPIMPKINPISDLEASQTVEHLLLNEDASKSTGYSESQILCDIIKHKKCDESHARAILYKIKQLGLGLFENSGDLVDSPSYDLLGFAETRQILSGDKLQKMYHRLEQKEKEQKEHLAELEMHDKEVEAKFVAQYGDAKTWSPEIWEKFRHETGYS